MIFRNVLNIKLISKREEFLKVFSLGQKSYQIVKSYLIY